MNALGAAYTGPRSQLKPEPEPEPERELEPEPEPEWELEPEPEGPLSGAPGGDAPRGRLRRDADNARENAAFPRPAARRETRRRDATTNEIQEREETPGDTR